MDNIYSYINLIAHINQFNCIILTIAVKLSTLVLTINCNMFLHSRKKGFEMLVFPGSYNYFAKQWFDW